MRKFVLLLCCAGTVFIAGCGRNARDAAGPPEREARDEQVIVFNERPMPEALYEMPDEEMIDEMPEEMFPEDEPGYEPALPEIEEEPEPADDPASAEPEVDPRAELAAMGVNYHKWAFIEAAGEGNLEVVRLFLESGMDPNEINSSRYRETALMWAARGGHAEAVSLLLEHGAEVNSRNSRDMTALGYALMFKHAGTASVLRAAGGAR